MNKLPEKICSAANVNLGIKKAPAVLPGLISFFRVNDPLLEPVYPKKWKCK